MKEVKRVVRSKQGRRHKVKKTVVWNIWREQDVLEGDDSGVGEDDGVIIQEVLISLLCVESKLFGRVLI